MRVYMALHGSMQLYVGLNGGLHGSVVGDNRELEVWGIFWGLIPIMGGS